MIFFGLLVHQTIEEIHRIALDDNLDTIDEPRIHELFDRTFQFLTLSDVRPIGDRPVTAHSSRCWTTSIRTGTR